MGAGTACPRLGAGTARHRPSGMSPPTGRNTVGGAQSVSVRNHCRTPLSGYEVGHFVVYNRERVRALPADKYRDANTLLHCRGVRIGNLLSEPEIGCRHRLPARRGVAPYGSKGEINGIGKRLPCVKGAVGEAD